MLPIQFLILFLLILPACGHKGPVRPLEVRLPAAPEVFEITQRGETFLLGWTIPTVNQDGSPLTDLDGFRVYRMRYLPQDDCPECRDTSALWREIDLDYLRDVRRIGNRLFMADADLQIGYAYRYRVVPVTTRRRPGAAAVAQRPFVLPPSPPAHVSASGHNRMVRLRWSPPADASEIVGYNIYRQSEAEPSPFLPVNPAPIDALSHEDFGLTNQATYHYHVRTVVGHGSQRVESPPSESVGAVPTPEF